jgi:RpiR family carbohydrate utilization transcriptional regulator
MNIIEKVQQSLQDFSKSERKVAEIILEQPKKVIHSSIATLAQLAKVSEPTVNRFCRRLETKGYPDFKLHLAQSLAHGTPYVNRHVDEHDSTESYTSKIFDSSISALEGARQSLNTQTINRAVDLLTQAKTISFFGLGASGAVAQDAKNKFFRFNLPVICFDDVLMQKMNCINNNERDVLVLISHTGRTTALLEIAQLAQENGAPVIAITAPKSPLSRAATLTIDLEVAEDTDIYMPMASRLAQLVVIDVLATGFTLRRGPKFRENLKRAKHVLKQFRLEKVPEI